MPFGSWRESELDTFAKIAKGQLNLPQTFSAEVVDLITKVMPEFMYTLLTKFYPVQYLNLSQAYSCFTGSYYSYSMLMNKQDWETWVLIMSKNILGSRVLIGKRLKTVVFLYLMRSPPVLLNIWRPTPRTLFLAFRSPKTWMMSMFQIGQMTGRRITDEEFPLSYCLMWWSSLLHYEMKLWLVQTMRT